MTGVHEGSRGALRRFALARAVAHRGALIALALVAAVAVALGVGSTAAVRAAEAAVVGDALAAVPDARVVVDHDPDRVDARAVSEAVEAVLAARGAAGVLRVSERADGAVVLVLDRRGAGADAVFALIAALPELRGDLRDVLDSSVQVADGIRSALLAVQPILLAMRGPAVVASVISTLLATVVVAVAAAEAARRRRAETHLLRARGASGRTLIALDGVEAMSAALPGALLGALVGAAGAMFVAGVATPTGVAVTAMIAAVGVAGLSAAVSSGRAVSPRSTRAAPGIIIAGAVGLTTLTVVAVMRYIASSGRVVVDGGAGVDPLVAAAPALVVAWGALLAVAATPLVLAALARLWVRSRRARVVTALRSASRRPARHGLAVTVVAFAVATTVLAALYAASVASVGDGPAQVRVGADVRVISLEDTAPVALIAAVDGVAQAMPVRSLQARGDSEALAVRAVDADELVGVIPEGDGAVDAAAIAAALTSHDEVGTAPIVMSAALADGLALEVGDRVSLRIGALGTTADLLLSATADILPGTPEGAGVYVDRDALARSTGAVIAADEVWLAADDPPAVAGHVDEQVPATRSVVVDPTVSDAATATIGAFAVAATASTILAILALLLRRSRTPAQVREVAVLAVIGAGRRGAAGIDRAEDLMVLVAASGAGVMAGGLLGAAIVPALVRSAWVGAPASYPVPVVVDPLSVLAVAGVVVLLTLAGTSSRLPSDLARALREEE